MIKIKNPLDFEIERHWEDVFIAPEGYAEICMRERAKAIDVAFEEVLHRRLKPWVYHLLTTFKYPWFWKWIGFRMEIRHENNERGDYSFYLRDELLADVHIENKIKIEPV